MAEGPLHAASTPKDLMLGQGRFRETDLVRSISLERAVMLVVLPDEVGELSCLF